MSQSRLMNRLKLVSYQRERENFKDQNPFARIEIPIQGSENQTVTVTNKSKAATFEAN